ncbi:MAG: hypothetical protein JWN30_1713 [Bacilli bacterium]|nr:hypothetical protein [Bacilli bacterium]
MVAKAMSNMSMIVILRQGFSELDGASRCRLFTESYTLFTTYVMLHRYCVKCDSSMPRLNLVYPPDNVKMKLGEFATAALCR